MLICNHVHMVSTHLTYLTQVFLPYPHVTWPTILDFPIYKYLEIGWIGWSWFSTSTTYKRSSRWPPLLSPDFILLSQAIVHHFPMHFSYEIRLISARLVCSWWTSLLHSRPNSRHAPAAAVKRVSNPSSVAVQWCARHSSPLPYHGDDGLPPFCWFVLVNFGDVFNIVWLLICLVPGSFGVRSLRFFEDSCFFSLDSPPNAGIFTTCFGAVPFSIRCVTWFFHTKRSDH